MKFVRNAAMLPRGCGIRPKLRRHRFHAAFGVGGYASGPMMLLAALHGIPSVVFEPNVEPGFTNRVLARMATRVAVAHAETAARFGRKGGRHRLPGAQGIFRDPPKEHRAPFTLLITGGSRGALPINRAVVDSLDRLAREKTSFSSCIRPANATIMPCEWLMRAANSKRRWCPSSRTWRSGLPRPT